MELFSLIVATAQNQKKYLSNKISTKNERLHDRNDTHNKFIDSTFSFNFILIDLFTKHPNNEIVTIRTALHASCSPSTR
jgi:hypothetical protein